MLNEHPVTIYPGPKDVSSGIRNNRCKRLQAVEKHKEICHIFNPVNTSVSYSSSSSSPASSGTSSDNQNHKTRSCSSNNTLDKIFKNNTTDDEDDAEENSGESEDSGEDPSGITVSSESTLLTPRGIAWEIHFKDFKKKTKQHQLEIKKVGWLFDNCKVFLYLTTLLYD